MILFLGMESWTYVSEGKGFVSEETISTFNSLARSKNAVLGWELKTPCTFGNNMLVPGQQDIENHGFGEYIEMIGKPLPSDSIGGVLSSKVGVGKNVNHTMTNTFSGEEESSSKLSSSILDSNSKDSSLIDLKLGRITDHRDIHTSKFSKGAPVLSSLESSTPPKRMRISGLHSQTAFCQVYGCNKDLSSSKDYHKRHKVCELHSKTAKVIVNGIEQRFCQQCSRLVMYSSVNFFFFFSGLHIYDKLETGAFMKGTKIPTSRNVSGSCAVFPDFYTYLLKSVMDLFIQVHSFL